MYFPLFSVTIPAYKGTFLKECIDSVLAQTYQRFELIIVNDHSPENLDEIINEYHDERIHYFKNKVGYGAEHVVGNWNKCLEYAKGDFIICMGDDDRLKPNFLEDLNDLIRKYPTLDVYYSRTEIINGQSVVVKVLDERSERESVYEMIDGRNNGRRMFIGDYCFRIETLRKKGGFYILPFAWGSDAITAYMMAGVKGIANTKNIGFQYRVNSQTISNSPTNIEGKMEAIWRERQWFQKFYQSEPSLEKDYLLYLKLKKNNDNYFERMAAGDLIRDISMSPIKASLKWLCNYRRYGLSIPFLFRCIYHGITKR